MYDRLNGGTFFNVVIVIVVTTTFVSVHIKCRSGSDDVSVWNCYCRYYIVRHKKHTKIFLS